MTEPTIVWLAGTGWDQITGTDKRIVRQIGLLRPVVWVDPPVALDRRRPRLGASAPEPVAPGVTRVSVTVLPGITRRGIRLITARIVDRVVASLLAGLDDATVVVAFPLARLPRGSAATRVLYVTDDWLDGAALMGFSPAVVRGTLRANLARADAVAAVTPSLLRLVLGEGTRGADAAALVDGRDARAALATGPGADGHRAALAARVVANGAPAPTAAPVEREYVAGLVGQINERLDMSLLEELVRRGVPLRIIGPRADRDPAFGRRLDSLLAAPGVDWLGPVPQSELALHLGRLGVGLTPYLDTPFNRASFPLKTLEYLSAGLRVVSSDLPASRWLDTPFVAVRGDATSFADAVVAELALPVDPARDDECRAFAARHSWVQRADELLELVDSVREAFAERGR